MTTRGTALIYTRQSVTAFDANGRARGPSLDQQLDAVKARPEFQGLTIEHFEDADRSGKETSRRPGYLALMERLRLAAPGEIAAVGFYDQDRLHRNALEFYAFMNECEQRRIPVFDASGPIRNDDELAWGIKAVVASAERRKIAKRVKDNLVSASSRALARHPRSGISARRRWQRSGGYSNFASHPSDFRALRDRCL